jgi:hypothetical protein
MTEESGQKVTGQMKEEARERQTAQRYMIHADSDVDQFLCLP